MRSLVIPDWNIKTAERDATSNASEKDDRLLAAAWSAWLKVVWSENPLLHGTQSGPRLGWKSLRETSAGQWTWDRGSEVLKIT